MQLIALKEDRNVHKKGDIIEKRASGTPFTGNEPNVFVMVEIPEPMNALDICPGYSGDKWKRSVEFEVVNQDLSQDGFRIRLYSATANNGQGEITKAEVENFINNWGGTVHSFGTNEVVFDIRIYDALVSEAFWEIDLSNVNFSEVSYDQNTGIHRIEADYSATANSPNYVEAYVEGKGLTIVSHADKVLTYDADRSVVKKAFQDDIYAKTRTTIARRRYYFGGGVIDTIVANGGTMTTDLATLQSYIRDKQAE